MWLTHLAGFEPRKRRTSTTNRNSSTRFVRKAALVARFVIEVAAVAERLEPTAPQAQPSTTTAEPLIARAAR